MSDLSPRREDNDIVAELGVTQASLSLLVRELRLKVADHGGRHGLGGGDPIPVEDWVGPTLLNSWADFGSGTQGARFRKTPDGTVHVQGTVSGGSSASAVVFTLPAGYRPAAELRLPGVSAAGAAELRITAAGDVSLATGGSTTWASIGVTFAAG